jgi:hypothetical protein
MSANVADVDRRPRRDDGGTMERRPHAFGGVVLGLLGATVFVIAIRWGVPSALTGPPGYLGRSRAWFVDTGIYAAESRGDQTSPVRWTGPTSRIVLRNLDRSQEYFFSLRLAAPERPPDQGASVRVFVDGAVVVSGSILDVPHRIVVSIPRRATSAGSTSCGGITGARRFVHRRRRGVH